MGSWRAQIFMNSKCSKVNAPSDSDSNQRAWWEPQRQARPKQAEIWSTETARYCQRWVAWMSRHKLPLQSVVFGATVWVVWVWIQSTHLLPRCSIVVAHLNILCRTWVTWVASRDEWSDIAVMTLQSSSLMFRRCQIHNLLALGIHSVSNSQNLSLAKVTLLERNYDHKSEFGRWKETFDIFNNGHWTLG